MLVIQHLSHHYGDYQVLDDINLTVENHQTVAILGTSGVGKTTLFNLIASNLAIQTGRIEIDGTADIKGRISYMLQKDMLFSHKTVLENIVLPLQIQGVAQSVAVEKAERLLEEFSLARWRDYYPRALSGGMRQRIAFLRTACFEREWVLLDEAFGALDAMTRRNMHEWFRSYRKQMGWSTLLITHDVEEALQLADKIYVVGGKPGRILLELKVELPQTDFEEMVFQPEFLAYKRELLRVLSVQ
ncbi:ABC transporter ATP-binding protein [Aerococcaceae bacterium NML160702]|nr:ABC transporter ATP-binding protein [Aerococcaceae bacterium NML160702]